MASPSKRPATPLPLRRTSTPRELRVARGTIRVRPPQEGESAAIAELLEQLGYPATEEQVLARLAVLLASPDRAVLVAELSLPTQERFVAGVVALEMGNLLHRDERQAEITSLVTDRRFRHRGVARALVSQAEAIARRSGCGFVHVRSGRLRDDAHGFWRALGFEESHLDFDKTL